MTFGDTLPLLGDSELSSTAHDKNRFSVKVSQLLSYKKAVLEM